MSGRFLIPIFVVLTGVVPSCKTVRETATRDRAGDLNSKDAEPAPSTLINGQKPVSVSEIPMLQVTVDVSNCVGQGKWFDPSRPATPRPGAVSLTLNKSAPLASGDVQPEARYFEPARSEGSTVTTEAREVFTWRLSPGRYNLSVIAIAVTTNTVESKAAVPIELSSSEEEKLLVKGLWKSTATCELSIQP